MKYFLEFLLLLPFRKFDTDTVSASISGDIFCAFRSDSREQRFWSRASRRWCRGRRGSRRARSDGTPSSECRRRIVNTQSRKEKLKSLKISFFLMKTTIIHFLHSFILLFIDSTPHSELNLHYIFLLPLNHCKKLKLHAINSSGITST